MAQVEERIAVLEAEKMQLKEDVDQLYTFFREHMEKEEDYQRLNMSEIHAINNKLDSQKSFVGGIITAVSGIWAIGVVIAGWFLLDHKG